MFILESDYLVLISSEQLDQILAKLSALERETTINECFEQSYEEIKEYLRHRFDVEFDMRAFEIPADNTQVSASENDRIYDNTTFKKYVCIQDAINQSITNTAYFEEKDNRNKKLVQITIDVFLYHLHTRLNPRNIPEHRKIRYDGDGDIQNAMSAIKWLLMVQKGTLTPKLTPIVDDDGNEPDTGQSVIFGNSPKDFYGRNNEDWITGQ